MIKEVILTEKVKDDTGREIATLDVALRGDGATPVPRVLGSAGANSIIGYNDDGTAIIKRSDDELIKAAKEKFIAKAIKEQKRLCVENGVDPDLVNILNAEKRGTK